MRIDYRVGRSTVRPALNRIERDGRSVRVKPKSMEVLGSLVERPGEVRSRRDLLNAVWGDRHVGEEVLTQAVAELRRAFGDSARAPGVIETIPRRGYRLVARVGRARVATSPFPRGPLAGREPEWDVVEGCLQQAAGGSGLLLLLAGEPGIGKTRLASEAMHEAREFGFLALGGRCSEDAGLPLLPFVEILERALRLLPRDSLRSMLGDVATEIARLVPELERIFPDLPPRIELPAEQQRRYLFNAILEVLDRGSRADPLCLVLDDLQWADYATVDLLTHLANEIPRLPVLVIGTFRDTELDPTLPFLSGLEELTRQRLARRIDLHGLSAPAVARMLESLGGSPPPPELATAIFEQTGGNPFFVEELFRHLREQAHLIHASGEWNPELSLAEDEAPEGVRLLILRRVRRLRPATRTLLEAAAIAGRSFAPRIVGSLIGFGSNGDELLESLSEAERDRLVAPVSGDRRHRYQFEHDLIRHALLSELPSAKRRQLHLRLAETLEEWSHGELRRHAADIAHHLNAAGELAEPARTLRFARLAGEEALRAAAFEDAHRHFSRALELVGEEDRCTLARLLFLRASSLRALGRWQESWNVWEESLRLQEELGEAAAAARTIEDMSLVAAWSSDWRSVETLARRGLAALGSTASSSRLLLLGRLGMALGEQNERERSGACFAEARRLAEEVEERGALGAVLMQEACTRLFHLDLDGALATLLEARDLLRGTRYRWEYAPALAYTQIALLCQGRWREIDDLAPELELECRRSGHAGAEFFARQTRSWRRWMETGDLAAFTAECACRLDIIVRVLRNHGGGMVATELALARFWRGDWDEAVERLQRARSDPTWFYSEQALGALLRVLACHDPEHARRLLDENAGRLHGTGTDFGSRALVAGAVEALLVLGRREEAASLYPALLEARKESGALLLLWSETLLEKVLALAATAGGLWDAAEGHWERSLRQANELPNLIERCEVQRWYARALIERGEPRDRLRATELLDGARRGYLEIGMPRHFALTESFLVDR